MRALPTPQDTGKQRVANNAELEAGKLIATNSAMGMCLHATIARKHQPSV
jgi:hypothetical protein